MLTIINRFVFLAICLYDIVTYYVTNRGGVGLCESGYKVW